MNNARTFLLIAIAACSIMLYQAWMADYGVQPQQASQVNGENPAPVGNLEPTPDAALMPPAAEPGADLPAAPIDPGAVAAPAVASSSAGTVTVTTDVLEVELTLEGAGVIGAKLLTYPEEVDTPEQPVILFNDSVGGYYAAQAGYVSANDQAPDHRAVYRSASNEYRLSGSQQTLEVPLTWTADNGVVITRTYRFTRGEYLIEVEDTIVNSSGLAWSAAAYRQLQRVDPFRNDDRGFTQPEKFSFAGAGLYSDEDKYEKYTFDDLDDEAVNRDIAGGWAAMVQHYFVSAWIPPSAQTNRYTTQHWDPAGSPRRYIIRQMSPALTVAAGATSTQNNQLFVGPKLQDRIEDIAPGLELTVDYGILTPFSKLLFWGLEKLHALVQNWGFAIILLTIVIKAAFFKLSEAQYRSIARMRKVQPRIVALKERFGEDKQKLNQAMMDLYKTEKINPMGGCLPVLVQIPVFISLYWVLLESVELRQAPFMLWIQNLSAPDPYFVLPVINGAAMFMSQKLSPNPGMDPMQQKILMSMPIVFSVMFAFFPAGLVLYWTVNSVLSLAQQWFITKRIEAGGK
ncbi:MAG: membrane protein insertase YidC [Lysobacteraceae bacterium]|nr:MAG: membrane protein insertase YidC [Xanthomonadaceae bacterium]